MKASELIEKLQSIIDEHGDIDIVINDPEWGISEVEGLHIDNCSALEGIEKIINDRLSILTDDYIEIVHCPVFI
jgi:hypothetical protein